MPQLLRRLAAIGMIVAGILTLRKYRKRRSTDAADR